MDLSRVVNVSGISHLWKQAHGNNFLWRGYLAVWKCLVKVLFFLFSLFPNNGVLWPANDSYEKINDTVWLTSCPGWIFSQEDRQVRQERKSNLFPITVYPALSISRGLELRSVCSEGWFTFARHFASLLQGQHGHDNFYKRRVGNPPQGQGEHAN